MFGPDIDRQILDYSLTQSPNEACGYISVLGRFIPCDNISPEPTKYFSMSRIPDNALAIVHSHPGGPFAPSGLDMRQQIASALPWCIAAFDDDRSDVFWFGDEAPMPPLLGRGFRHGVTDCYALVRHMYMSIHNIDLPDFPRKWEWWDDDQTLFVDGYRDAGFSSVPISDVLPADILLFSIRSQTPNHSGIYLGRDLILHHLSGKTEYEPSRLSTVENVSRLVPHLSKVLRHENNHISREIGQKIWTQF